MTHRSFAKMQSVYWMKGDKPYVQTGFVQRGLGIAWRLKNIKDIEPYFSKMPVSSGVVLLHCGLSELRRRNVERGKDRSAMLTPMAPAMLIASTILAKRGVAVLDLDAEKSVEVCRARLSEFVATSELLSA